MCKKIYFCLVHFFDDGEDDDNKALTQSLVISVCVYFLLPITASLSPDVSFNMKSIFLIPQFNNSCLLLSSSKAVVNFVGDIDASCCIYCSPSFDYNSFKALN